MEGQPLIAQKLLACFLLSQQTDIKAVNQQQRAAATCTVD